MGFTGDMTRTRDVRDPSAFTQLLELERQATRIYLNQPLFVPGLLQVPGYATQMISRVAGLEAGDPQLQERVKVRTQRAETLLKRLQSDTPPHIWAALDEGVVRRAVGGVAVWREQLAHLATIAKFKTVHLAIIPFSQGAHPGLGGSFEVHELANGDGAAFFEGAHADEFVDSDPTVAQRYRETVKHMVETGVDARKLLETISGAL